MVMHNRQSALDMTLLLGLWLVWGYSWIASKLGLAYATPLQMAEYRLTLALLMLRLGLRVRPRLLTSFPATRKSCVRVLATHPCLPDVLDEAVGGPPPYKHALLCKGPLSNGSF